MLYSNNNHYYLSGFNLTTMTRNTSQKKATLRAVKETSSHPTAGDIYGLVRKEIPNISLGTVYRNLKFLKQEGKILELDLAGTISRFDGNTQNHYHFRCEQCGHIFDVDDPLDRENDDRVAQKTGFKISYHRLEFCGLCKDCQHEIL